MKHCARRILFGIACGVLMLTPATRSPNATAHAASVVVVQEDLDTIIFKDGRTVKGRVLEETSTSVRIEVIVAGISAEQTYQKSNILTIDRAAAGASEETESEEVETPVSSRLGAPDTDAKPSDGAPRVYVMELTGEFGRDISQTPIRKAMSDARKNEADYVIVVMDNDWSEALRGGLAEQELLDDTSAFDQLFRAEDMDPIFHEELRKEWDNPPKVVFWVKTAMGGAAFLPLNCSDIYFHSEGRMGGVGFLSRLFGDRGDEVVRDKQISLRLKHAEGMAITGGYDPRLVKAMTIPEYVLSYRMERGKPVLLERMPEAGDEILLTDDALEENADTDAQLVRGMGDDHLNFTADIAKDLGLSKGTVDTLDDLLYELGLARDYRLVSDDSERIMENWTEGLREAGRRLRLLGEEYADIQVQGDYNERQRARGRQIGTLNRMIKIIVRYEEAMDPREFGLPPRGQLEAMIAQIRLEMLADRK